MAERKIKCPVCSSSLTVDAEWGGQEMQCPMCHETFRIPQAEPETENPADVKAKLIKLIQENPLPSAIAGVVVLVVVILIAVLACSSPTAEQTAEAPAADPQPVPAAEEVKLSAAELYELGLRCLNEKNDPMGAEENFRKSAEQGYWPAMIELGAFASLTDAEAAEWLKKGIAECKKMALTGDRNALQSLHRFYAMGLLPAERKVVKDLDRMILLTTRNAAGQGDAQAQFYLARCFNFNTHSAGQNIAEAVKWYNKAAEQGLPDAQVALAGISRSKSYTEAVKWYRTAAENGDMTAQFYLARCYALGEGVDKDLAEAVKWYRAAAEKGNSSAAAALIQCYEDGTGVAKDPAEAANWRTRLKESRKLTMEKQAAFMQKILRMKKRAAMIQ